MDNSIKARAYDYLKNVPEDWFTITVIGRKLYCATATIEKSDEPDLLGPVIADILKNEYGYRKANYHTAKSSITISDVID
jgi:hypothetical protein